MRETTHIGSARPIQRLLLRKRQTTAINRTTGVAYRKPLMAPLIYTLHARARFVGPATNVKIVKVNIIRNGSAPRKTPPSTCKVILKPLCSFLGGAAYTYGTP